MFATDYSHASGTGLFDPYQVSSCFTRVWCYVFDTVEKANQAEPGVHGHDRHLSAVEVERREGFRDGLFECEHDRPL